RHIHPAFLLGIAAVAVAAATASVCAQTVIAEFNNDFTPTGVKPGWSFLWNANGPIGSGSTAYVNNFAPLQPAAGGGYIAPGTGLTIFPAPDAASMPSITPGPGSTQGDRIERYAIVGYTVNAADIAASGGGVQMFPYRFSVLDTSSTQTSDGIRSAIYANTSLVVSQILPPDFVYDSSAPDAYAVSVGLLRPGDTVYIATGPRSTNTGDLLNLDFTLTLSPMLKVLSPTGKLLYGPNIAATVNAGGIDVANHDAVYSYGNSEQGSAYQQFRQWILQGQAGQGGIYTSSPTYPGTSYPAVIAPVDNHQLHLTDFGGTPVASQDVYNQILLKYTLLGDTNLDGKVTDADLVNIIANMGHPGSYLDGDVNLDGMVDINDYNLVMAHLGESVGTPLPGASQAAVPEPGMLAVVGLALALGCRIGRRRSGCGLSCWQG
ncbi:MAG: dockerin type I repeat-containing protein, partial [Tepidisphaerales bacterium]